MLIKTKETAFKLRLLDFPPSSALAMKKDIFFLPLTVHPTLFFMTAPHDTFAPVLPFSPEFPLQSVCILLSAFQPLVLLLIRPSCRGHAHCHSPWSCVHHNTLYSNADVYGHSRIINSWKCSPRYASFPVVAIQYWHFSRQRPQTGICRNNKIALILSMLHCNGLDIPMRKNDEITGKYSSTLENNKLIWLSSQSM